MVLLLNKFFRKKIPDYINTFIWDVDGTLYQETGEINQMMCKVTINYIHERTKDKREKISQYIYDQVKKNRLLGDIVEEDYKLDKHLLAEIAEYEIDKSVFVKRNHVLVDVFDNHFAKYRHAILTNGSLKNTKKILKRIGFKKTHFSSIHTREDMGKNIKPSREAFNIVMKTHNIRPSEVMMVGDSLTTDIYPAKELGMATCFVFQQDKPGRFEKVDFVINNPVEITKIL